ncbi:hypothetical protein [Amycolatopsis pigmentata]|uniref:Uncharacterized protein n=1 Tax=Amycolatopsis pigmentata TaxID=450801 RepID=A0ABW5FQB0_9PSEU
MPSFGRRRGFRVFSHSTDVPGLAKAASAQGWQPAGDEPFGTDIGKAVREITQSLYGVPRDPPSASALGSTSFSDTFRGTFAGRTVTVANAWTPIDPTLRTVTDHRGTVTVCAVRMPSILRLAVQPRGVYPVVPSSLIAPTGNPVFDEWFTAAGGIPGTIEYLLTPRVQQRIMAHDDWVFRAEGYLLACVRKGKFRAIEEISRQVAEVMDVARAIPESVRTRYADHTADDLATRISRLEDIDAATAFLQDLGRADREDLAASNTPLAAFAYVRTPQQFMARFESLDPQRRMELFAMFMRANGDRDPY